MTTFAAAVSAAHAATCPQVLDFQLPTLTEDARSLCQFSGQVVLVVNTASRCGLTPQYKGLEQLHRKYKDKGLVVLGFPANDFGGQEPGSNKDIANFCEANYGVSFTMFAKSAVVGPAVNPFYARLAEKTGDHPRWNFHKYLIDRSGKEVLSFASEVAPSDPKLVAAIERMLSTQ